MEGGRIEVITHIKANMNNKAIPVPMLFPPASHVFFVIFGDRMRGYVTAGTVKFPMQIVKHVFHCKGKVERDGAGVIVFAFGVVGHGYGFLNNLYWCLKGFLIPCLPFFQ